jgi:hypothetical protein
MNDTLEEFNRAYSEKEQWAREMGIYGFAEKLERERDEARTELEMWRDGNIMHQIHRDELEKVEREREEAREEHRKLKIILDLIKKETL